MPATTSNIPEEAEKEATQETVADEDRVTAVTSAAVAAAAPAPSTRLVDTK